MRRRPALLTWLALCALALTAHPAMAAYDPRREDANIRKTGERERYEWSDPAFQARMDELGSRQQSERLALVASDPERQPANACGVFDYNACLGDVRLWDWAERGHGIVRPILFTARSGATLSGRVWATRDGPSRRPLVVYVTGSVQVPEAPYWFVATTLAKRGYVVLTFDEQGEGASDTSGEGVDRNEGVPAQAGRPFFDGAEDALDFALSTPSRPYRPRPSCTTGTDHSPKQDRRVAAGLNAPYNPLWALVDAERVGLAGQSFGARGASYVGQVDRRVDAIVAHDNLAAPGPPSADCASAPQTRPASPRSRVPALGISNDYGLFTPQRYESAPNPLGKSQGSLALSAAGVDTMQVNIRGGTHQECAWVFLSPDLTPATLRGVDLCAWYTAAWFDKYLRRDPTADRRLFTRRWHADPRDAQIDASERGNLLSFYYRSRADVRLSAGGRRARCDDLRDGCHFLTRADGWPGLFDRISLALSADGSRGPAAYEPALRDGRAPIATVARVVSLRRVRRGIVRVRVRAQGAHRGEIRLFEMQVRRLVRGTRWRSIPSSRGFFSTRLLRGRFYLVRVRAVDQLGGVGPWTMRRVRTLR